AVSSSRSGVLLNLLLTACVAGLLVPTLAMMQFANVMFAVALFDVYGGLGRYNVAHFVAGLGLTQLIVLIGWATARWLRLQVLVHDKGPMPSRNRWDVRRRAWWDRA